MLRFPVLAVAVLIASAALPAVVYVETRPAPQRHPVVVLADRVAQAVSATSRTKSFRFSSRIVISAGSAGSLAMDAAGAYDAGHRRAAMTMSVENAAPGSAAAYPTDVVVDSSDGLVEYLRSGMLDGHLPAGKTWVKIDVGKLAKEQDVDLQRLMQADNADPSRILDSLRRAAAPVYLGAETAGGVETSHYRATIDPRRLLATQIDPTVRESLRRAIEATGATSYPVDVWIDGAGYLRRMQVTEQEPVPGGDGLVGIVTATEELSRFGEAVRIDVPSPADAIDVTDLRG